MGENLYQFRKATLQDCGGDIKKRWYISFYVWDVQKNDLVRKREYSINQYKTKEERLAAAKLRIKAINELLADGYHIDCRKVDTDLNEFEEIQTLEDSLKKILEIKKAGFRKKSYQCFHSTLQNFLAWAKKNRLSQANIQVIDRYHAQLYQDYLITEKGLSGKTVNNKIAYLKTLFNGLIEREVIKESPFSRIKKQKEIKTYQNAAFTNREINELKNAIEAEAPDLFDFIQFIYYCYLRPGEIRMIRKEHVDLSVGVIFIPATISKNAKNDHVDIPGPFRPVLEKILSGKDHKDFLFPGTIKNKPVAQDLMTRKHKNFLVRLGFDNRHTLYSWKHTGVVQAYKAGVDIKSIQRQCRHHSIEMTDNYLKSLGLYQNQEFLLKMPGL